MNLLTNLALLSALTLPLAAQRTEAPIPSEPPVSDDPAGRPKSAPVPASLFTVELKVDLEARLATMASADKVPFFGFMVAATQSSMLDVPGIGGLLEYELIVATALCLDGVMALDLGTGGWGFDVYLQGIAISEFGAAMTSIEIVRDNADQPHK